MNILPLLFTPEELRVLRYSLRLASLTLGEKEQEIAHGARQALDSHEAFNRKQEAVCTAT